MKSLIQSSHRAGLLRGAALALIIAGTPFAHAVTFWTGPTIGFTQSAATPADVLIPGVITLTRNGNNWLFNTNVDTMAASGTPSRTLWAFGDISNYTTLSFATFDSYRPGTPGGFSGVLLNGGPMVVRLLPTSDTNDDIYLSLTFTAWPGGGGNFAYVRSTPAVVSNPSPSVNITNPAGGAVFAAPANVKIAANATVAGGTVTNVSFFANATSLGAVTAAPFSLTASNLTTGAYALTAVAKAGGIASTSPAVNITVVTPVTTTLSGQAISNNQFSFNYSANPGLSYVVQNTSTFTNWLPIVTNVAASNSVHFNAGSVLGGSQFYRVGRLPNP